MLSIMTARKRKIRFEKVKYSQVRTIAAVRKILFPDMVDFYPISMRRERISIMIESAKLKI